MRELSAPLLAAGARPVHVAALGRAWLAGVALSEYRAPGHLELPAAARALLPALERELDRLAQIESEHPAADGGVRFLLRLHDGRSIESVLLPRAGVCVSTQVGCAVGCTFCATGLGGLERQLSSTEILAQVALARRRRRDVRRVVFMGMGEPSHNLAAVMAAIDVLGGEGGFGHKELVFSTVGEPRVFEELGARRVKPALALSLHTTSLELRTQLLPRAPRVDPAELVESALAYCERSGHPLQLQWTLLAGVNDGDEELEQLLALVRGRRVVVNYIPYNPIPAGASPGLDHSRVPLERARAMAQRMHQEGVLAKLRRSAAAEVEGACGQLRARHAAAPAG